MKRLLVVDDDVESLAVTQARLDDDEIEITCATGGRAGLEAAKSHHPDLILLDLDMPDMTGFDVCRILKADPELCMIPSCSRMVKILILHGFEASILSA